MTTVDVLRKARELYAANPSHAASDELPEAGTVCLLWATDRAARPFYRLANAANDALRTATGSQRLVDWNATHSTEEGLAAFDRAIEAEKAKA